MDILIRPAKAIGSVIGARMAARAVRRATRRALVWTGMRPAWSPLPALGLATLTTLVGVGVTLAFTPRSGEEFRRELGRQLRRAKVRLGPSRSAIA